MVVYKCDRCKKEVDLGLATAVGDSCMSLSIERHNCRGFCEPKQYLLCEDCMKGFENFMDGLEVVAP